MRIFINYNYDTLHRRTQRLNMPQVQTTDQLIQQIRKKLNIQDPFSIKFNIDGQNVRVIPGWSIVHYGIKHGSSLHLQFQEGIFNSQPIQPKLPLLFTMPSLEKIQEEEIDEQSEGVSRKQSVLEINQETENQLTQTIDNNFHKLLKAIKNGDLNQMKFIISRNPLLLNEYGEAGWTLMHYAVFYQNINILEYLINLKTASDEVTSDGWTPLQLAIKRRNINIFKKLVGSKIVNINKITEKGTALMLSVKLNLPQFVDVLIQNKADDSLKDEFGKKALDFCDNPAMISRLTGPVKPQIIEEEQNTQETNEIKLVKATGVVYRERFLMHMIKQNYLSCDPLEGSLVRFEKKQHYPKKPKQVIPLLQVTRVQIMKNQDKSSMMKKGYFYFEVYYPERLVLSTKSYQSTLQWVQIIFDAANYVHNCQENINTLRIPDIIVKQIMSQDENQSKPTVDKNSLKNQKSHDQQSKPKQTINRSQSVFNQHIKDKNPFSKHQSLDEQPKTLFETPIANKNDQKVLNSESYSPKEHDEAPISSFSSDQNFKDGTNSNYSSFASSGKKNNTSTMVEEIKIGISSFDIIKQLGSGSFGKVFLARFIRTKQMYALKVLKKSSLILKKQLKYAVGEANVLKKLCSPFILQLHYAFQTPQYLYLCLDYCPYGDLSQYLINQNDGVVTERQAKLILAQLVIAVEHMHKQNVIYRDMKPENILIGADGFIRLADFGLSKGDVNNNLCASFCGSPAYLSPEMLKQKGVGKQSDVYGLGCILYEMLVGEPPYYDDDVQILYQNIQKGNLKFTARISASAKEVIQKLLQRDPVKRITLDKLKKHSFLKQIDFQALFRKEIGRLQVDELDAFQDSDDENVALLDNKKPIFIDADYPDETKKTNRVNNFSFSRS